MPHSPPPHSPPPLSPPPLSPPRRDSHALTVVLLAGAIAAWQAAPLGAWPLASLAVAASLGWAFVASGLSFTAAFRAWQQAGEGARLATLLLIPAVAAVVVLPMSNLVPGYGAAVAPPGIGVAVGAAIFGLGMQLANGCGSGTLAAAGAGAPRMWIVLPWFCAGGVFGSLALPAIQRLPTPPAFGWSDLLGPWGGLAVTLALLGALAAILLRGGQRPGIAQLRAPLLVGALAAVLFLVTGTPWGITSGLTLWGGKLAVALGVPLADTPYWAEAGAREALAGPLLANTSSRTNIGMILGAAACAAWQGRLRRQPWPSRAGMAAAVLGGVLMGFGARLSFGCNIGAFVGGVASGSLHGFLWFAAVLPGSWLGIRLRPRFGLSRTA